MGRPAGGPLLASLSLLPAVGLMAVGLLWSAMIWSDWRVSDRILAAGEAVLEGRTPSGTAAFEFIATSRIAEPTLVCPADMRRALALVEVTRLERSLSAAPPTVDAQAIGTAADDVRRSLRCTPTDGFLWFALGWLTQLGTGPTPASWDDFMNSYEHAPYESWVALRRSGYLAARLDIMPPELRQRVLREFRDIVSNGFYGEAMGLLTGPGWPFREELIAALHDAEPIRRANFARILRNNDIRNAVPGVPQEPARPWH